MEHESRADEKRGLAGGRKGRGREDSVESTYENHPRRSFPIAGLSLFKYRSSVAPRRKCLMMDIHEHLELKNNMTSRQKVART